MSPRARVVEPPVDVWGEDNPATASPREFQVCGAGDRYTMRLVDVPITFELDRPRWDHGDLIGQLKVTTDLSGARTYKGVLSVGTFNVSGPRARTDRARQVASMAKAPQIDWERLLEEFCIRCLDAEATGQPAVDLRNVARPLPDELLVVDGVPILERHPLVLFGDGGVAKSYLALYFAGTLALRGVRVLYADWELDAGDHRDRLERIFGPEMPQIFYAKCTRPLSAEADRLKRLVLDHEAGYLVCDSVAFACDGPPEAAEVAGRYYQALRQIGVGSLNLAHITKGDNADQRPFGSAFWHNGARATWNVKLAGSMPGSRAITIGLFNRKANLGPLLPAIGFRITFSADRTTFEPTDVARVDDLAVNLTLKQRIYTRLSDGKGKPQTIGELAAELDASKDSIEKTLKRHQDLFVRVPGGDGDGIHRYALVERRTA